MLTYITLTLPLPQNNMYNLGNFSPMFAFISGQKAPAFSLSYHFGPELSLLFKFRQLILRKVIKIAAIRCHYFKAKCHKFDFSCGSAPDRNVGAHSPGPLAGFNGSYF